MKNKVCFPPMFCVQTPFCKVSRDLATPRGIDHVSSRLGGEPEIRGWLRLFLHQGTAAWGRDTRCWKLPEAAVSGAAHPHAEDDGISMCWITPSRCTTTTCRELIRPEDKAGVAAHAQTTVNRFLTNIQLCFYALESIKKAI